MNTAQPPPPPFPAPLRLRLVPQGALPRPIDGAWWPRSYDLLAELPGLLAGLPRTWGHVTSVTVTQPFPRPHLNGACCFSLTKYP